MLKKKLKLEEQILHMKHRNNIQFEIMSESEALSYLKLNTYYFKLKSYAKNYPKYTDADKINHYVNLDFAYLVELSKLDMYFRRFIIKMSLDIEHFLKTQLLRDFEANEQEDGYAIVKQLFERYPYIEENILKKNRNSTCSDLISKYEKNFAIWNIVEVLSFGDFTKLYGMYYQKYNTKGSMEQYLWSVRYLRNAAAHNCCLLNSLKRPYSSSIKPNLKILNYLSKIKGISREERQHKMKNPAIHDFVVTLYVYNNLITSNEMKMSTMSNLKEFFDIRAIANKEYFKKNQLLRSHYNFFKTIIDYHYYLCV